MIPISVNTVSERSTYMALSAIEGLLVFVMSCNILGFLILELLELEIVDSSEINFCLHVSGL
jgi:hypothetical protein